MESCNFTDLETLFACNKDVSVSIFESLTNENRANFLIHFEKDSDIIQRQEEFIINELDIDSAKFPNTKKIDWIAFYIPKCNSFDEKFASYLSQFFASFDEANINLFAEFVISFYFKHFYPSSDHCIQLIILNAENVKMMLSIICCNSDNEEKTAERELFLHIVACLESFQEKTINFIGEVIQEAKRENQDIKWFVVRLMDCGNFLDDVIRVNNLVLFSALLDVMASNVFFFYSISKLIKHKNVSMIEVLVKKLGVDDFNELIDSRLRDCRKALETFYSIPTI